MSGQAFFTGIPQNFRNAKQQQDNTKHDLNGDDDPHDAPGLLATQRQVVNLRQVHDHADVDEGRCEQVRDRYRVHGNGKAFADAVGAYQAIAEFLE